MASLSNINGLFDVHSTGAIQFNGNHGTAGQILKSNGNAAPTWVAASTVIGGPYLPLTGGTLTGATATASGISFTVGGTLTGTSATFSGNVTATGDVQADQFISTNNGGGQNYRIGDDAWIGDINVANTFRISGNQNANNGYITFGNSSNDALGRAGTGPLTWGSNFTITGNVTAASFIGNASTSTTFSTGRTNYKGVTDAAVIGQMMWKNYGNNHTIFDASSGTSPQGNVISNINSINAWTATYPTLMGWNGSSTYGVRVDSARIADSAANQGNYLLLSGGIMSGNIGRSAHNVGFLVGGYNNVGASEANTSPIYAIGTSYLPTATALSNMYGIGYARGDASFMGVAAGIGWGMYVAADGDARIFLDAGNGDIYANNRICVNSYANQAGGLLFSAGQTTGTTRSLNLRTTGVTSDPSSSDGSNSTGITWGQRTDSNPYYIIKPTKLNFGGAPYSKLTLNWHTGIRIGGHKNYGGTKFYNDAPDIVGETGVIMNVGVGNDNIGIVNALTVGGNVTAPTFVGALTGNATTASSAAQVTINYNNNSNANYQMLWGSGNNVYGTAGVVVNAYSNTVTATTFNGALTGNATSASNVGGLTPSMIVSGGSGRKSTRVYSFAGTSEPSGFYFGNSISNNPPTSDWLNYIQVAGDLWTSGNNYSFQLTHAFHSDNFWVSRTTNGSQSTARLVLDGGGSSQTKSGALTSGTSMTAPVFYDTNTSYYGNFASTSVLNALQFNYTQHGSANNIRMGNSTTMNAISSGTNNAAFGVEALGGCSTGSRNFAYGYASLFSLSSGGSNIAMGDATGYNVTSGSNNLLFGQNAGRTGYQSPYQSIAGVTSGSNQIHMGNESHSTARIQISWTVNSDSRDKTDVTPIDVGLDFVKDLNPVTFRWDKRSDYKDRTPTGENKLEELTLGFLAQEVEEVEKSYGYDVANKTNLVVDRDVEQDHFGITYEKMIPILTKAIQELEARVKELENK